MKTYIAILRVGHNHRQTKKEEHKIKAETEKEALDEALRIARMSEYEWGGVTDLIEVNENEIDSIE